MEKWLEKLLYTIGNDGEEYGVDVSDGNKTMQMYLNNDIILQCLYEKEFLLKYYQ